LLLLLRPLRPPSLQLSTPPLAPLAPLQLLLSELLPLLLLLLLLDCERPAQAHALFVLLAQACVVQRPRGCVGAYGRSPPSCARELVRGAVQRQYGVVDCGLAFFAQLLRAALPHAA